MFHGFVLRHVVGKQGEKKQRRDVEARAWVPGVRSVRYANAMCYVLVNTHIHIIARGRMMSDTAFDWRMGTTRRVLIGC